MYCCTGLWSLHADGDMTSGLGAYYQSSVDARSACVYNIIVFHIICVKITILMVVDLDYARFVTLICFYSL